MQTSDHGPLGPAALARERAFAATYREHSAAVYAAAASVCGVATADDVTQDVFLRLWRGTLGFDPTRGTMRGYLVVAARNASIDRLRSASNRRRREDKVSRSEPRGADRTADAVAITHDEQRRVLAALEQLPSERRAPIVLAFFGGLPYRVVATALGQPEGTVKSRIRAGLTDLARLLN